VAAAAVAGRESLAVTVKWLPVRTPLQDLLDGMSWLGGSRELYQPLESPELDDSWVLVRRCTDRLEKMQRLLGTEGLLPPATGTYLDVASCYGWFVASMRDLGFEASGIERDPLARPLGAAAYGLDPAAITTGNAEDVLAAAGRRWDVVSCFSLLHHFVLGRGSVPPEELVRRLDAATGRVLFLDTGQEHEAWFRQSLSGWSTEHVERFLREHTTFDRIVDLGPDSDARGPYTENYARTLFACIRDS
jgi:hypothetical protein